MVDVLFRAADAGDTYVSWRWMDDLDNPRARRLDAVVSQAALARLDRALMAPLMNETADAAEARAMTGDFVTLEGEQELAAQLASAVLPEALIYEILARNGGGERVRLRLTPSPRIARVPWETLCVDESRRLLDVADIVYDPPATVRAERSVSPDTFSSRATFPAVYVIDPLTPTAELRQAFDTGSIEAQMFKQMISSRLASRGVGSMNARRAVSSTVKRSGLHEWLTNECSRLFYFGHVSSEPEEPGSASLHLSDTDTDPKSWGLANPIGSHRPLCALDFLLGTTTAPEQVYSQLYKKVSAPGHQIWPMPPRVALIACEGGADFRARETFGLVIAMLNAGAELVTTTRWPLPTDTAFVNHQPAVGNARPTAQFALTVDEAHSHEDPLHELAIWQRTQLDSWQNGGSIVHTPLVWASLINTWAPTSKQSADAF